MIASKPAFPAQETAERPSWDMVYRIIWKHTAWGCPGGSAAQLTHLPMQETQVWSMIQEDPTCCRAAKPVYHNYWACALEPRNCNHWSPNILELVFCNNRSHRNEKPASQLESSPCSQQLEKSPHSNKDSAKPKIINIILQKRKKGKYSEATKMRWLTHRRGGKATWLCSVHQDSSLDSLPLEH